MIEKLQAALDLIDLKYDKPEQVYRRMENVKVRDGLL